MHIKALDKSDNPLLNKRRKRAEEQKWWALFCVSFLAKEMNPNESNPYYVNRIEQMWLL